MIVLAAAVSTFGTYAGASEWVTVFNGKDIEGWQQKGGQATYEVENGCIVETTQPRTPNTFVCLPNSYGYFDVKCDPALNSGVQTQFVSSG